MKKKALLVGILLCVLLFPVFSQKQHRDKEQAELQNDLIALDVTIDEEWVRLDSVYTHIERQYDSDTYLISYQSFDELKDLIQSNAQYEQHPWILDANSTLGFVAPDQADYNFYWYASDEQKSAVPYEDLKIGEHTGQILLIERICDRKDTVVTQQYALLAEE